MIRQHRSVALVRALCAAVGLVLLSSTLVHAQAPVVFMTADTSSTSRLVRFNSGVEAFAATTGSSSAFVGTTVLNGDVLVADYDAGKIQRFSQSGTLLSPFASSVSPTFLESDSSGNVYTTQLPLPSVAKRFNSAGTVTQTFGSNGELSGIDADAAGNVYIANRAANALVKFSPAGTFLNSTPISALADDLAIDEIGKRLFLVVESRTGSGINIYDIAGVAPVLTGNIPGPVGSSLIGVHYAPESGHVFGVDFLSAKAYEYTVSGSLLYTYQPSSSSAALDVTTLPVPEPTACVLVCLGSAGLAVLRRR